MNRSDSSGRSLPLLRSEIADLLAAYGHAIDRCDAEAWADLFHPDGVSRGPGRATLRGRADLVAWVRDHPRPDLRHTCTNVWIETVDRATVRVASHYVIHRVDPLGEISVFAAGSYHDEIVEHKDNLVFRSRTATPLTSSVAVHPGDDPSGPTSRAAKENT